LFNPFLVIKNKWLFISSEGFYALEKRYKKRYVSEGNASHPVRCASLLEFSPCFEFDLAGSGTAARADKNGSWAHFKFEKSTPNGHYYLQWAVAPGQIPQQILLQRAGTP
jgi:hypothetical protein